MYFLKENFLLVMIWVVAVLLSLTSFIALQKVYPSYTDIFLGHTLYAIAGMPNAFLHIVGFYTDNIAHQDFFFYLLAAAYWIAICVSHYWYAQEREGKYLLVIAFFVLGGSVKWLYFATALMRD